MNGILVFRRNFQEHLLNLGQEFKRGRSSGISLNLSKCVFATEKVDFLGFELLNEGIKPQGRLTEAVDQFKCSGTRKELESF